jgi:hypothetical protein
LVFTLGPGREHARRRWLRRGFEALGRELHERCLDEVLAAGRAAGCALRVSTPEGERLAPDAQVDDQPEAGFSNRLLGAVRRAGGAGGPLIVVGTDTPGLDAGVLAEALEGLRRDPDAVVLGPAADGGVYLVASNRPVTQELARTEWRSRRTLASLVAALRRAGRRVRLLPVRADLDSRGDLERWVFGRAAGWTVAWSGFVAALRAALVRLAFAAPPRELAQLAVRLDPRSSRAPPR